MMLRRLALPAATWLMLSLPALAETVSDFRLPNGLEVVVIEDHRAPVVTHMVWYRVGAADEPPGHSGIAHFLEHLMFKGTDELAAGEFSATVEAQGGDDNAFTSWDYTAYFQRVAADRLDLMMKMEADRMRDLEMTEEDVRTERQVVLEERSQRIDSDPGSIFSEQSRAAAYLNHPYGIPIIGWRHEIEQLGREDAFSFYRTYYAPNNAILVVAGDVDPAEVRRMAEAHYGPLEPSANLPERLRPQEPPQLSERRLTFTDPRVAQPYVSRSYLAPARQSGAQEKAAALTILAELLGGSPTTSLLARELQFGERPRAVWAQAWYNGGALDSGSFGLAVVPVPGVPLDEAEEAMDAVVARFLEEGPDPEDFERIKIQLGAQDIYSRDNVDGLARRYGAALTTGLTVEDVKAWPDVLQAVTPEDVMAAAREVFDRRRAVTGWLMQADEETSQ
ncbi:insulinase family protein [Cereibacter azotoformans]|uniref:M16 family metallopeptidase n=1 Tax=Cereibacter azotoformans TaxID=43057 RepID=UPI001EEA42CD|nr:pitrilysin family protein [Cereibacter azotoformans]ULB10913.1 insulinase family protein [Cereibacter azotoformans]